MAGLTDKGFDLKNLNEVIRDLRGEASRTFSDLVPDGDAVDTSDSTILGRLSKLVAPSLADLWEAAQDVYSSFDPDIATGESLDNLVKYSRLSRRGKESSSALVRLLAEVGATIPAGSSVRSRDGESWEIPSTVSFSGGGSTNGVVIKVELVPMGEVIKVSANVGGVIYNTNYENTETDLGIMVSGLIDAINLNSDALLAELAAEDEISVRRVTDFNDALFSVSNCEIVSAYRTITVFSVNKEGISASVGDISQIETPTLGWYSVTNPHDALVGRKVETDEELRERFRDSKFTLGSSSVDALYSKLRGVDGVVDLIVYENLTDSVGSFGTPAHAFSPVVLGGDDLEIANIIWQNRPLGIPSYGNTEVTVLAVDGKPKEVQFERPTSIPIKIKIELIKEFDFPDNGVELIKNRVIDYFRDTYRIGTNVNYSKLFIPVNQVEGHHINNLQFGKVDEAYDYSAIQLNFNEVATITYENIEVTAI